MNGNMETKARKKRGKLQQYRSKSYEAMFLVCNRLKTNFLTVIDCT